MKSHFNTPWTWAWIAWGMFFSAIPFLLLKLQNYQQSVGPDNLTWVIAGIVFINLWTVLIGFLVATFPRTESQEAITVPVGTSAVVFLIHAGITAYVSFPQVKEAFVSDGLVAFLWLPGILVGSVYAALFTIPFPLPALRFFLDGTSDLIGFLFCTIAVVTGIPLAWAYVSRTFFQRHMWLVWGIWTLIAFYWLYVNIFFFYTLSTGELPGVLTID